MRQMADRSITLPSENAQTILSYAAAVDVGMVFVVP